MAKDKKEKPAAEKPAKEKKPKAAKAKGGGIGELFLKKGEWIALGGAGALLVLLLFWGVGKGAKAEDPTKAAKEMADKAAGIHSAISRDTEEQPPPLPEWVKSTTEMKKVNPAEFALAAPMFDITARPDTKRDNPDVVGIQDYQIDLVRAPMKAYDIRQTANGYSIAVRVTKEKFAVDPNKIAEAKRALQNRFGNKKGANRPAAGAGGQPPGVAAGGQPPGVGIGGPPGGMQLPGGSGGGPPGGSGRMGMAEGGFSFGGAGGFEANAARSDTVIEYISVDNLDTALSAGKVTAPTVVPIRLVVVNATIPLKKQLEEFKRALRLKDTKEAEQWGPIYDGYEVQRKVTGPRGVVAEWADYAFEDVYDEFIYSRKLADHFDVNPNDPKSQYLPYFLRYDQALVLPLPELVTETGGAYPELRLDSINKTIDKMVAAARPALTASEQRERLNKKPPSKVQRYNPTGGAGAAAVGITGLLAGEGGPIMPGGGPGAVPPGGKPVGPGGGKPPGVGQPPLGGAAAQQQPIEVEDLLLRFIDADVKPGHTYQYRIRLKMENPNFGQKALVRIPAFAEESHRTLKGKWVEIPTTITVPQENFLFAFDPATYKKTVEDLYGGSAKSRALLSRFQARDTQAVVQIQQWRQEVRTGDGGKREPIGAWIVTEMPVDRGGYIGRRQYVKLPLWSSELQQYVLREIPDKVMKGEQPKGWLVDFSDQSILVDFEGGKTKAVVNGKTIEDDVGEELLILGRDGKLTVRHSVADEKDTNRQTYSRIWNEWLKVAETRKATSAAVGTGSEFEGGGKKP